MQITASTGLLEVLQASLASASTPAEFRPYPAEAAQGAQPSRGTTRGTAGEPGKSVPPTSRPAHSHTLAGGTPCTSPSQGQGHIALERTPSSSASQFDWQPSPPSTHGTQIFLQRAECGPQRSPRMKSPVERPGTSPWGTLHRLCFHPLWLTSALHCTSRSWWCP